MLWLLRWVLQIRPVHNIAMRQLHSARVRVCSYSPRSLPRLLARSLSLPIPLPFPTRTVSLLHLVCFFSLHLSPLSVSPLPSAPALRQACVVWVPLASLQSYSSIEIRSTFSLSHFTTHFSTVPVSPQAKCVGHRGDFFTSNYAKRSTTTRVCARVWMGRRATRLASAQCARTFGSRAERLALSPLRRLCHFAWRRQDPHFRRPSLSSFPLARVALRPCLGAADLERCAARASLRKATCEHAAGSLLLWFFRARSSRGRR